MKTLLLLLPLTLLPTSPLEARPQAAGAQSESTLREVRLSGTALERGRTHGRELRSEIEEMVGLWRADVERTHGMEADRFVESFLAGTDYVGAIERWTPDLLDEVRGIAEGSGIPFDTMFAYQLIDELWAVGRRVTAHHCTAIGVPAMDGRPTLLAQNLDIPRWMHAHPTVLRIAADEKSPETLVLTLPGIIGANGMNAASIGVTVNTLLQLAPTLDGLPVAFVVRGILAQANHADAVAFVTSIRHASGQNYIVGGEEDAPGYECSAETAVRFLPQEESRITYHTNHPLVNTNWNPAYLEQLEQAGRTVEQGLYRCQRFESLQKRLEAGSEVTLERMIETLSSTDHVRDSICTPSAYLCTVFVLDADEPELLVAPGRPDRTEFARYTFGESN